MTIDPLGHTFSESKDSEKKNLRKIDGEMLDAP